MINTKMICSVLIALYLCMAPFGSKKAEASWQQQSQVVIQKDWKENSKTNGVKALQWKYRSERATTGNEYLPVKNKVFFYKVSNPNPFVVRGRFFANAKGIYVVEFVEKTGSVCIAPKSNGKTEPLPGLGIYFNTLDPALMRDKSAVYYRKINQPQYFVMDPNSSFVIRMFLQQEETPDTVWALPQVGLRVAEKTELRCSDSNIPKTSTGDTNEKADKVDPVPDKIGNECKELANKHSIKPGKEIQGELCKYAILNKCVTDSDWCEKNQQACSVLKENIKKACTGIGWYPCRACQ